MKGKTAHIVFGLWLLLLASWTVRGQEQVYRMPKTGNFMHYIIEDGDTVYVAHIKAAYCTGKGKKPRNWRDWYRLVHNFGKVYNYALEAGRLKREIDSTYAATSMTSGMKQKYINSVQDDLLDKYEPVLRQMTYSQGKLLIVLIDRETGITPYDIIKDYKSGTAAAFWQGIAKLFEGDLKKHYDPYGKDAETEELVEIWNRGEYPAVYRSVFGKDPEIATVPKVGKKEKARQDKEARKAAREAEKARKAAERAARKAGK